jgi:CRP-like cAMP-binding protein
MGAAAIACSKDLCALLDNPFLHDLTPEQFDLLSALFEPIDLPARIPICRQGEPATYMYLLQAGAVQINYKPYDGPRISLTKLHKGDVFGWSAVIGNDYYTSDAISTTSVQVLRARGATLRRLCVEYPAAGRAILERLAQAVSPRWVHAQEQVQSMLKSEVFHGIP